MQHKVFISYHRKDEKYKQQLEQFLKDKNIQYYSVSEDDDFDGLYHQTIKDEILENMEDCNIVICLVGTETYSRPHVDWELHNALKGGIHERKGIVVVLLEDRCDSIYNINYKIYPPRLYDNKEYVVLTQFSSLNVNLNKLLNRANSNKLNSKIQVKNNRPLMELRTKIYFDKRIGE